MIDFTNCPVDKPWILHDGEGNTKVINHTAEFVYARLIIAQNGYEDYYLTREGDDKEYHINCYGSVEEWPDGLFDSWEKMAGDILCASRDRKQSELDKLDKILEEGHWNTEIDEIAKTMKPMDAIKYLKDAIGHHCTLIQAKGYYDKFIKINK